MSQGGKATGTEFCGTVGSSSSLQWEMDGQEGDRSVQKAGISLHMGLQQLLHLFASYFLVICKLFVSSVTEHLVDGEQIPSDTQGFRSCFGRAGIAVIFRVV